MQPTMMQFKAQGDLIKVSVCVQSDIAPNLNGSLDFNHIHSLIHFTSHKSLNLKYFYCCSVSSNAHLSIKIFSQLHDWV